MTSNNKLPPQSSAGPDNKARHTKLSSTARRALEEAEARRAKSAGSTMQKEIGGRKGPDPARFGDWENKGIVSDF